MTNFTFNNLRNNVSIVLFVVSLLLLSSKTFSQIIPDEVVKQNNLDKNSSFHKIKEAVNSYWDAKNVNRGYINQNGIEVKVPNWKLFKRWEYYWDQRANPVTGEFPSTNSVIEYEKYKSTHTTLQKTNDYTSSWTNLGTSTSTGGYAGIGRINCIAFHPTDNNTFWVGSPSGGIWKTTNGGSSWINLNDNQSVLGVSAIAVDYTNPDIIYIATGDRDGGSMASLGGGQSSDNVSIGVLKSTDGGTTWNTTELSFPKDFGTKLYDLTIHPTSNLTLFASTSEGIFKTTDGGNTWYLTSNSYPCWRIGFKPDDPDIMYGTESFTGDQYFDISTDGGESWDGGNFFGSGPNARRTELAVTSNNPNVVYLLTCNSSGGVNGIYKSTDSGANFFVVNAGSPSGMLGYFTDGSGGSGGQGDYDWCIAVDPTNANIVYIGGITTWKSTDGGSTFTALNNWTSHPYYNISGVPVVHADKHSLIFQNNTTLFEGNDGGIYKTTNGGTNWTDLTNGMVISQVYRLSVSQTNSNIVITGLQDNGTKLYNTGFWTDVKGGDGMECIVDYADPNYMYGTYTNGQITRSINGFTNWQTEVNISANIPGGQPSGAWVTPYVIDQNNNTTLFAGYDRIWKTTDRGDSWTSASQILSSSQKLRSLAIAPSNSSVLYTADLSNMWKTTDGGATNWSVVTLPTTATSVTYIAVKNTDPNTVWITYGGYTDGSKVYESTDGGANWTNISAGLPNLPVMSIVHYKTATSRDVLFVGTDVGVYVKDGINNWESYSTGLPNVVVSELDIYYGSPFNKLRAATFGRGLWETNIDVSLPVELSSFTGKVNNNSVLLSWITQTETNNYGFNVERKLNVKGQTSDVWETIGFVNGNGNSNSTKNYSYNDKELNTGKYLYRLKQIDNDGQFTYSNIVEVNLELPTKFSLEQNYPNPFSAKGGSASGGNPNTTIRYQLPQNGMVTLKVYDILGKEVATLVNEYREAGSYEIEFSAKGGSASGGNAINLPSGVYFYQLQAGSFIQTKKMTLVK